MAEIRTLAKILHIREQEKNEAQKAYQSSTKTFEEIAGQLYSLLKKKEDAEAFYESCLKQVISIDKIKEKAFYIEQLNKQISDIQINVQKARYDMELKQEKLTGAYVEAKKFEKIIEHRKEALKQVYEKQEKALMDEVSIQQYLSQKIR